jgi:hypothetical protein
MRKRVVRAAVYIAIALGIAVGAAEAAGAVTFSGPHSISTDGSAWD